MSAGPTGRRVARVLVPTRGPSPLLRRLVEGVAGRGRPVVVVVDDPDPAAALAARTLLADQADTSVWGATERAAHEVALAEASRRPDAVEAALRAPAHLPWKVGALRNLVLLLGVGEVALSVDDDVVAEAVPTGPDGPPEPGRALDPTAWWPVAERSEAWAQAAPVDLAGLHDGWVGGGVVVSSTGLAGDSGGSRASAWLAAAPEDRARMLEDHPARLVSRAMVRAAPRRTVTDSPWFMAPCFAFDGDALLPPFLPVHRNTDGLWGLCLAHGLRAGRVLHQPWAVRHDPPGERRFQPGDVAAHAVRLRTTDLVGMLVLSFRVDLADPEARCRALARHVGGLSAAPDAVLQEVVAAQTRAWLAASLGAARRCLDEGGPPAWLGEVKAAVAALTLALDAPPPPEEHAVGAALDAEGYRGVLRRFALALDGWPALVRAARDLRSG